MNKTLQEQFQAFLRKWRGDRSQQQVCDELGMNRSYFSELENGKRSPSLRSVDNFLELADIDVKITLTPRKKSRRQKKRA